MARWIYEKRKINQVDILVEENIRVSRVTKFTVQTDGSKNYSSYSVSGSDNLVQATGSLNGEYLSNACATYYQATEFVLYKVPGTTEYRAYYCGYVDDFLYKIIVNATDSGSMFGNVYRTEERVGEVIETVRVEEGTLPNNGKHTDGYWYVKKSRAINFKYKDINGIVYDIAEAKYKDANGNIVDIASAIYKDSSGNISGTEVVDPEIPTDPEPTDPEIPTEGLVCYLDTRGKTNTDTDRETLLDLSGNGNHGTLQNFSFTEESGYVKDISSGYTGLNFDGIDDDLLISTSYVAGDPFTQFIDFEIKYTAKTQGVHIFLGSTYIHSYDDYICLMGSDSTYIDIEISPGRYQLCFTTDGNHLRSNAWIDGVKYTIVDASDYTFTNAHLLNQGKKAIYKYAFWDRELTDQEIQKLFKEN